MAAAILERFDAGIEISLIEGSSGVLDIAIGETVVYSKKELGIMKDEVSDQAVGDAIEEFMKKAELA